MLLCCKVDILYHLYTKVQRHIRQRREGRSKKFRTRSTWLISTRPETEIERFDVSLLPVFNNSRTISTDFDLYIYIDFWQIEQKKSSSTSTFPVRVTPTASAPGRFSFIESIMSHPPPTQPVLAPESSIDLLIDYSNMVIRPRNINSVKLINSPWYFVIHCYTYARRAF